MKYLKQLGWILLFSVAAEALAALIPLPIPAAIYGILLMLCALCTGLLKPEAVSDTAQFLIRIMPLLFVAPAVNILKNWGIIAPALVPVCIITGVSTVVVFAISGLVTKLLRRKEAAENG